MVLICFRFCLPYFNYRFPFDWRTPIGFVFAIILESFTILYANLLISCSLSSGVGVYMWGLTMTKDIKINLNSINEIVHSKNKRSKLSKRFNDTVHYHSVVKQLSTTIFPLKTKREQRSILICFFADLYNVHAISNAAQPIFAVLTCWSLITMCLAMLIMNTQIV